MFSTDVKNENGFEIIVLKDDESGTSAEIIPACGAILHAFKIKYNEGVLNIIDNYPSEKSFNEDAERLGFKGCKLSPFVCRMKEGSYKFGEKKYRTEKFYLGEHALHGLIYDAVFEVVSTQANADSATVELLFSYKASDAGYPFKYDCRIVYELKKENELSVKTFIKNNEATAIPVADGWHPYFCFGSKVDHLQLQLNANEMLEYDEALLPTGKKLPSNHFTHLSFIDDIDLDHGFIIQHNLAQPAAILRDPVKKMQLEISTDKSYPILQVYIPDHRNSIAIENLSAAPDCFNNQIGLTVLGGGKEAVFSTSYKVVKDH